MHAAVPISTSTRVDEAVVASCHATRANCDHPVPNSPLPIDSRLDEILGAVRDRGAVVVEAEPGAGKTTRVPPALLSIVDRSKRVVVLEPRRLAARAAAEHVARELGERVGQTVGTIMRFERRVGPDTRLLYVTEAVLTRWLVREPTLPTIGAVVFDEIHERNLHSDLALALVAQLRQRQRSDLCAIAMSATLDAKPIAAFLDAEAIACSGRVHEVSVEHQQGVDRDDLDVRIAKAVRRVCREELAGHVLVFLPGAREIERAQARCQAVARDQDLLICPLHGRLPPEVQDRALTPSRQRKLILATNIAETSLTIDGVVAVIDSGLARTASHDRSLQRSRLALRPISQASATQRAGRAGRTQPGRCIRLYTDGDFRARPAHDTPEIERADLGEALLLLCAAGVELGGDGPRWLTAPPAEAVSAASRLLHQLEAIDASGKITPVGERMTTLPLHPRLARVALEAARHGVIDVVLPEIARVVEGDRHRNRSLQQLERQLARAVDRWKLRVETDISPAAAEGIAWLRGFPDQVAKRSGSSTDLALADGGRATLPTSLEAGEVLGPQGFGIVLEARERPGNTAMVQRIHPIELDWLLDGFPDDIEADTRTVFNSERQRVESIDELRYRGLVLEQSRSSAKPSDSAAKVLFEAAREAGIHRADPDTAAWIVRVAFAAEHDDSITAIDQPALEQALADLCTLATTFAELKATPLHHLLRAAMSGRDRRVDELAPQRVNLSRCQLSVQYPTHEPPFVESYLQDFFGMSKGPSVAGEPLVLRLWAPNGRPIQVTRDLAGFWERHYPKLRKELSRRYPKHHWADDPVTAVAVRLKRYLSTPPER